MLIIMAFIWSLGMCGSIYAAAELVQGDVLTGLAGFLVAFALLGTAADWKRSRTTA